MLKAVNTMEEKCMETKLQSSESGHCNIKLNGQGGDN